jgi:hypothetical protein
MISRRSFIAGSIGSTIAAYCPVCSAVSLSKKSVGCFLAPEDFDAIESRATRSTAFASGSEAIIWKSGDNNFDLALAQSLAKIANAFEILPGFAFYDDEDSPNAYATPRTNLDKADGSVFFGLNLLKESMAYKEAPEVAVATICAHEFAHILQYKHGLIAVVNANQRTVKNSELQADYFAGYFTGLRKRDLPTYSAAVAALTQFKFGDTSVTGRDHHGTHAERGAAVARGFEAAYREKKSLNDAIQESTNYVMTL